jgi:hypothetical protein
MPPWKVSRKSSIVNKTSVFGIMGGIVNSRSVSVSSLNRATTKNVIPSGPIQGFNYMAEHGLLSTNPLGSGGVKPTGPYLGNRSLGGGSSFDNMSNTLSLGARGHDHDHADHDHADHDHADHDHADHDHADHDHADHDHADHDDADHDHTDHDHTDHDHADSCTGGRTFMSCASACTKTCDNKSPICTEQCVPRCQCPASTPYWDDLKQTCMSEAQCAPTDHDHADHDDADHDHADHEHTHEHTHDAGGLVHTHPHHHHIACQTSDCVHGILVLTSASKPKDPDADGYWNDHRRAFETHKKGLSSCVTYSKFIWLGTKINSIDKDTFEITYGENLTNEYDRIKNQRDFCTSLEKEEGHAKMFTGPKLILTTASKLNENTQDMRINVINKELNDELTDILAKLSEPPGISLVTFDSTQHISDSVLGFYGINPTDHVFTLINKLMTYLHLRRWIISDSLRSYDDRNDIAVFYVTGEAAGGPLLDKLNAFKKHLGSGEKMHVYTVTTEDLSLTDGSLKFHFFNTLFHKHKKLRNIFIGGTLSSLRFCNDFAVYHSLDHKNVTITGTDVDQSLKLQIDGGTNDTNYIHMAYGWAYYLTFIHALNMGIYDLCNYSIPGIDPPYFKGNSGSHTTSMMGIEGASVTCPDDAPHAVAGACCSVKAVDDKCPAEASVVQCSDYGSLCTSSSTPIDTNDIPELTQGARRLHHDHTHKLFAQAEPWADVQIKVTKDNDTSKLHSSIKHNIHHFFHLEYRNNISPGVWGPWQAGDLIDKNNKKFNVTLTMMHDRVHMSGVKNINHISHLKSDFNGILQQSGKHQVTSELGYTSLIVNSFSAMAEDVNSDLVFTELKYLHRQAGGGGKYRTKSPKNGSVPAIKYNNFYAFSADISNTFHCSKFSINRTTLKKTTILNNGTSIEASFGSIDNKKNYNNLLLAIDEINLAHYYNSTVADASNQVAAVDEMNDACGCNIIPDPDTPTLEASNCHFVSKSLCSDVFNPTEGPFACGTFTEVPKDILGEEFVTQMLSTTAAEATAAKYYSAYYKKGEVGQTTNGIYCPNAASDCLPAYYNITAAARDYVNSMSITGKLMLTTANNNLTLAKSKLLYEVNPTFTDISSGPSDGSSNFWAFSIDDVIRNNFSMNMLTQYFIHTIWYDRVNKEDNQYPASLSQSFITEKDWDGISQLPPYWQRDDLGDINRARNDETVLICGVEYRCQPAGQNACYSGDGGLLGRAATPAELEDAIPGTPARFCVPGMQTTSFYAWKDMPLNDIYNVRHPYRKLLRNYGLYTAADSKLIGGSVMPYAVPPFLINEYEDIRMSDVIKLDANKLINTTINKNEAMPDRTTQYINLLNQKTDSGETYTCGISGELSYETIDLSDTTVMTLDESATLSVAALQQRSAPAVSPVNYKSIILSSESYSPVTYFFPTAITANTRNILVADFSTNDINSSVFHSIKKQRSYDISNISCSISFENLGDIVQGGDGCIYITAGYNDDVVGVKEMAGYGKMLKMDISHNILDPSFTMIDMTLPLVEHNGTDLPARTTHTHKSCVTNKFGDLVLIPSSGQTLAVYDTSNSRIRYHQDMVAFAPGAHATEGWSNAVSCRVNEQEYIYCLPDNRSTLRILKITIGATIDASLSHGFINADRFARGHTNVPYAGMIKYYDKLYAFMTGDQGTFLEINPYERDHHQIIEKKIYIKMTGGSNGTLNVKNTFIYHGRLYVVADVVEDVVPPSSSSSELTLFNQLCVYDTVNEVFMLVANNFNVDILHVATDFVIGLDTGGAERRSAWAALEGAETSQAQVQAAINALDAAPQQLKFLFEPRDALNIIGGHVRTRGHRCNISDNNAYIISQQHSLDILETETVTIDIQVIDMGSMNVRGHLIIAPDANLDVRGTLTVSGTIQCYGTLGMRLCKNYGNINIYEGGLLNIKNNETFVNHGQLRLEHSSYGANLNNNGQLENKGRNARYQADFGINKNIESGLTPVLINNNKYNTLSNFGVFINEGKLISSYPLFHNKKTESSLVYTADASAVTILNSYKTVVYNNYTVAKGQTLDISNTISTFANPDIIKIVYNVDISKSFVLKVKDTQSGPPTLTWDICNNTSPITDFTLTQQGTFFQKIPIEYKNNNGVCKLKAVSSDTSSSYLDIDISMGKLILSKDYLNCAEFQFVETRDFQTPSNNMSEVVKPYVYLKARKRSTSTNKSINPTAFNILSNQQHIIITSSSGEHINIDVSGSLGMKSVNMRRYARTSNIDMVGHENYKIIRRNDWTHNVGRFSAPLEASGTFMYKSATQLHNCNITLDPSAYSNTVLGGDYSSIVSNTNNINNLLYTNKHDVWTRATMLRLDISYNSVEVPDVKTLPIGHADGLRDIVAWTYMSTWDKGGRGVLPITAPSDSAAADLFRGQLSGIADSGRFGGILIGQSPDFFENYNSQAKEWCIGTPGGNVLDRRAPATALQAQMGIGGASPSRPDASWSDTNIKWGNKTTQEWRASPGATPAGTAEALWGIQTSVDCLSAIGTISVGELIVLWNNATWIHTSDASFVTGLDDKNYKLDMMTCVRGEGNQKLHPTLQKSLNGLVICNRHLELSGSQVDTFLRKYSARVGTGAACVVDRPANFFIPMAALTSAIKQDQYTFSPVTMAVNGTTVAPPFINFNLQFDFDKAAPDFVNTLVGGIKSMSEYNVAHSSIYKIIENNNYVKKKTNIVYHIPKKNQLDVSSSAYWNANYGGVFFNGPYQWAPPPDTSRWTVADDKPVFSYYNAPGLVESLVSPAHDDDGVEEIGTIKDYVNGLAPHLIYTYANLVQRLTDFTVVDMFNAGLGNPTASGEDIGKMKIPKNWASTLWSTLQNQVDITQDDNEDGQMSETAKIFGAAWTQPDQLSFNSIDKAKENKYHPWYSGECGTGLQYISRMQANTALWRTDNTTLVAMLPPATDASYDDAHFFNKNPLELGAARETGGVWNSPSSKYNITALTGFPISSDFALPSSNPFSALFESLGVMSPATDQVFRFPEYRIDPSFGAALVGNMTAVEGTLDPSTSWHTWQNSNKAGGSELGYTLENHGIVDQLYDGNAWEKYRNPFGGINDSALTHVCPPGALYHSENDNSCYFNNTSQFTYEPVLDAGGFLLLHGDKAFKLISENNEYLAWVPLDLCGNNRQYHGRSGTAGNMWDADEPLNVYKLVVVDKGGTHDLSGQTVFYHNTLEMSGSVISSRIYASSRGELVAGASGPGLGGKIWLTSLVDPSGYYKLRPHSTNFYISDPSAPADTLGEAKDLPSLLLIGNMNESKQADFDDLVENKQVWEMPDDLKTRFEFDNLSFSGVLKFNVNVASNTTDASLGTVTLMSVSPTDLNQATNEINLWDRNQDVSYSFAERVTAAHAAAAATAGTNAAIPASMYYSLARGTHHHDIKTYSNLKKLALNTKILSLTSNDGDGFGVDFAWGKYTDIPKTSYESIILQNNYIEINSTWNVINHPSKNLFAKNVNHSVIITPPTSSHQYSTDMACFRQCAQEASCNAYSFTSSQPCLPDISYSEYTTKMSAAHTGNASWPDALSADEFEHLTCKYIAKQAKLYTPATIEKVVDAVGETGLSLLPWMALQYGFDVMEAVETGGISLVAGAAADAALVKTINSFGKIAKYAQMLYFGYQMGEAAVDAMWQDDTRAQQLEDFYHTGRCNIYSGIAPSDLVPTAADIAVNTADVAAAAAADKFNHGLMLGVNLGFSALLIQDAKTMVEQDSAILGDAAAKAKAAMVAARSATMLYQRGVSKVLRDKITSINSSLGKLPAANLNWIRNVVGMTKKSSAGVTELVPLPQAMIVNPLNGVFGAEKNMVVELAEQADAVQGEALSGVRAALKLGPHFRKANLDKATVDKIVEVVNNAENTLEAKAGELQKTIKAGAEAMDDEMSKVAAGAMANNEGGEGGGRAAVLVTLMLVIAPIILGKSITNKFSYVRNLNLVYSTDASLSSFNNCFNDTIDHLDGNLNVYKNDTTHIEHGTNSRRFFNYVANTVCGSSSKSQPNGVKYMNKEINPAQSKRIFPTQPILFPTPLAYHLTSQNYDVTRGTPMTSISYISENTSHSYVTQLIALDASRGHHINFTDIGKLVKTPNTHIYSIKKHFGYFNFLNPLNTTVNYVKTIIESSGINANGIISGNGYQDFVLSDINSRKYICHETTKVTGSGGDDTEVTLFYLQSINSQNTLRPSLFRAKSDNKLSILNSSGESMNITFDTSFNTFYVGGSTGLSGNEVIAPNASPVVYFEGGLKIESGAKCIIGKNTACYVSTNFNNNGILMNNGDLLISNTGAADSNQIATNTGQIINGGDSSGGARIHIKNFDFNNGEIELFALMDTCNNYLHYDWTTKLFSIKQLIDPTIESFKQFYVIPATTNLPTYGSCFPNACAAQEGTGTGDGVVLNPIYELCMYDPSGATTRHANIFSSQIWPMENINPQKSMNPGRTRVYIHRTKEGIKIQYAGQQDGQHNGLWRGQRYLDINSFVNESYYWSTAPCCTTTYELFRDANGSGDNSGSTFTHIPLPHECWIANNANNLISLSSSSVLNILPGTTMLNKGNFSINGMLINYSNNGIINETDVSNIMSINEGGRLDNLLLSQVITHKNSNTVLGYSGVHNAHVFMPAKNFINAFTSYAFAADSSYGHVPKLDVSGNIKADKSDLSAVIYTFENNRTGDTITLLNGGRDGDILRSIDQDQNIFLVLNDNGNLLKKHYTGFTLRTETTKFHMERDAENAAKYYVRSFNSDLTTSSPPALRGYNYVKFEASGNILTSTYVTTKAEANTITAIDFSWNQKTSQGFQVMQGVKLQVNGFTVNGSLPYIYTEGSGNQVFLVQGEPSGSIFDNIFTHSVEQHETFRSTFMIPTNSLATGNGHATKFSIAPHPTATVGASKLNPAENLEAIYIYVHDDIANDVSAGFLCLDPTGKLCINTLGIDVVRYSTLFYTNFNKSNYEGKLINFGNIEISGNYSKIKTIPGSETATMSKVYDIKLPGEFLDISKNNATLPGKVYNVSGGNMVYLQGEIEISGVIKSNWERDGEEVKFALPTAATFDKTKFDNLQAAVADYYNRFAARAWYTSSGETYTNKWYISNYSTQTTLYHPDATLESTGTFAKLRYLIDTLAVDGTTPDSDSGTSAIFFDNKNNIPVFISNLTQVYDWGVEIKNLAEKHKTDDSTATATNYSLASDAPTLRNRSYISERPGVSAMAESLAHGSWTAIEGMPIALSDVGAGVIDGKIYVVGGTLTNGYTAPGAVFVYDPSSASPQWTTKAISLSLTTPTPASTTDVGVVVVGKKIYMLGGRMAYQPVRECWVYDPADAAPWKILAPMSQPRYAAAIAELGGRIYVMGGRGTRNAAADSIFVYDIATNTWNSIYGRMPEGAGHGIGAAALNNSLYLFGGRYGARTSNFFWRWSPGSFGPLDIAEAFQAGWTQLGSAEVPGAMPLNPPGWYSMKTAVLGNKIYLLGGLYGQWGSNMDKVYAYDPSAATPSRSWTLFANPFNPNRPSTAVLNGKIYALGGTPATNQAWSLGAAHTAMYSCNGTTGQCTEDAEGTYSTIAECETKCPPMYSCNGTTGQCTEDASGAYSTIADCETKCPPTVSVLLLDAQEDNSDSARRVLLDRLSIAKTELDEFPSEVAARGRQVEISGTTLWGGWILHEAAVAQITNAQRGGGTDSDKTENWIVGLVVPPTATGPGYTKMVHITLDPSGEWTQVENRYSTECSPTADSSNQCDLSCCWQRAPKNGAAIPSDAFGDGYLVKSVVSRLDPLTNEEVEEMVDGRRLREEGVAVAQSELEQHDGVAGQIPQAPIEPRFAVFEENDVYVPAHERGLAHSTDLSHGFALGNIMGDGGSGTPAGFCGGLFTSPSWKGIRDYSDINTLGSLSPARQGDADEHDGIWGSTNNWKLSYWDINKLEDKMLQWYHLGMNRGAVKIIRNKLLIELQSNHVQANMVHEELDAGTSEQKILRGKVDVTTSNSAMFVKNAKSRIVMEGFDITFPQRMDGISKKYYEGDPASDANAKAAAVGDFSLWTGEAARTGVKYYIKHYNSSKYLITGAAGGGTCGGDLEKCGLLTWDISKNKTSPIKIVYIDISQNRFLICKEVVVASDSEGTSQTLPTYIYLHVWSDGEFDWDADTSPKQQSLKDPTSVSSTSFSMVGNGQYAAIVTENGEYLACNTTDPSNTTNIFTVEGSVDGKRVAALPLEMPGNIQDIGVINRMTGIILEPVEKMQFKISNESLIEKFQTGLWSDNDAVRKSTTNLANLPYFVTLPNFISTKNGIYNSISQAVYSNLEHFYINNPEMRVVNRQQELLSRDFNNTGGGGVSMQNLYNASYASRNALYATGRSIGAWMDQLPSGRPASSGGFFANEHVEVEKGTPLRCAQNAKQNVDEDIGIRRLGLCRSRNSKDIDLKTTTEFILTGDSADVARAKGEVAREAAAVAYASGWRAHHPNTKRVLEELTLGMLQRLRDSNAGVIAAASLPDTDRQVQEWIVSEFTDTMEQKISDDFHHRRAFRDYSSIRRQYLGDLLMHHPKEAAKAAVAGTEGVIMNYVNHVLESGGPDAIAMQAEVGGYDIFNISPDKISTKSQKGQLLLKNAKEAAIQYANLLGRKYDEGLDAYEGLAFNGSASVHMMLQRVNGDGDLAPIVKDVPMPHRWYKIENMTWGQIIHNTTQTFGCKVNGDSIEASNDYFNKPPWRPEGALSKAFGLMGRPGLVKAVEAEGATVHAVYFAKSPLTIRELTSILKKEAVRKDLAGSGVVGVWSEYRAFIYDQMVLVRELAMRNHLEKKTTFSKSWPFRERVMGLFNDGLENFRVAFTAAHSGFEPIDGLEYFNPLTEEAAAAMVVEAAIGEVIGGRKFSVGVGAGVGRDLGTTTSAVQSAIKRLVMDAVGNVERATGIASAAAEATFTTRDWAQEAVDEEIAALASALGELDVAYFPPPMQDATHPGRGVLANHGELQLRKMVNDGLDFAAKRAKSMGIDTSTRFEPRGTDLAKSRYWMSQLSDTSKKLIDAEHVGWVRQADGVVWGMVGDSDVTDDGVVDAFDALQYVDEHLEQIMGGGSAASICE